MCTSFIDRFAYTLYVYVFYRTAKHRGYIGYYLERDFEFRLCTPDVSHPQCQDSTSDITFCLVIRQGQYLSLSFQAPGTGRVVQCSFPLFVIFIRYRKSQSLFLPVLDYQFCREAFVRCNDRRYIRFRFCRVCPEIDEFRNLPPAVYPYNSHVIFPA